MLIPWAEDDASHAGGWIQSSCGAQSEAQQANSAAAGKTQSFCRAPDQAQRAGSDCLSRNSLWY